MLLPTLGLLQVGLQAMADRYTYLAAIGLEILGLGPSDLPSLGMLIFWAQYYDAVFRGMWWWFLPPIIVLVLIFSSLFMISAGLDRLSNPRLRSS